MQITRRARANLFTIDSICILFYLGGGHQGLGGVCWIDQSHGRLPRYVHLPTHALERERMQRGGGGGDHERPFGPHLFVNHTPRGRRAV
jgi:hypothetical protein